MVKVEDLVASRRESLAAGGKGISPSATASVAGGGDQVGDLDQARCALFLGFAYFFA